ncbi:MAG: integrin alpha, partial [Bacteroidota bacterium]
DDSQFGQSLASMGDANGDGVLDFAVGAPNSGGSLYGGVYVLSGDDGRVLSQVTSPFSEGGGFGSALAARGTDLVVGAPLLTDTGDADSGAPEAAIDSGWALVFDVGAFVTAADGAPEAAGRGLAVALAGPNPSRGEVVVAVTLSRDERRVRVDVVDVLGRVVKTLSDGPARRGRRVVRGSVEGLAPGVYAVVTTAGAYRSSVSVTVL